MFKKNYLHPDSASAGGENATWWRSGRTSIYIQAFTGWGSFARQQPQWNVGALTMPKWDGGGPADKPLGVAGYSAYVAVKKGSEERVKELLRFCDFCASPFGTEEQFLLQFGLEGTHFKREGGEPIRLPAAEAGGPPGVGYIGSQGSSVLYVPNGKDLVQQQYEYLSQALPTGVSDPTLGLYSEAFASSGAAARTAIQDLEKEIVVGRKTLADWDAGVDRWRKETGDQQRQEYQEALQKQ